MTKPTKILVFGATSAIAYEIVKLFAKDGAWLYLCARSEDALKRASEDLIMRGAKEVVYSVFDAFDENSINDAISSCFNRFPDIDGLIIAHGLLPDQYVCESDIDAMKKSININFTSAAIILTRVVSYFEKKGNGTIVVISSAAGDRGRQSNYIYGSAKGALTIFLSGLRQRLHKRGVRVITIKPGFVDTPMTANLKKGILFVGPEVVAKGIYNAIIKGKDIAYVPWFWWWIMLIIKHIPEKIFKKIKL